MCHFVSSDFADNQSESVNWMCHFILSDYVDNQNVNLLILLC